MQKITPFLWIDKNAEDAMNFYTSIFKNSRIVSIKRYPDGPLEEPMKGMEGKVLTGVFELDGQRFMALDGGPIFKFTPSVSFLIACKTKEEVDELWKKLSEEGTSLMELGKYSFSERYGWLQDKFGVSWQLMFVGDMEIKQKITPTLMFVGKQSGNAEEAIKFYTSIFKNSKVGAIMRYEKGEEPDKEGTIKHAAFTLENQEFAAMDSAQNHLFTFTEAISFYVECETQEEVDEFWEKLSAYPESEQCGWLKDKFGLSWQIIPRSLPELLNDSDPEKSGRVLQAMLQMKKIDVEGLKKAYNQE